MRRLQVVEHIVVYDHPPGFGKGVPEFYDLKVFDVPHDAKDRIVGLLRQLGFVEIRDESVDSEHCGPGTGRVSGSDLFIRAQYHTGSDQIEYENFWDKKEVIELEIDDIQMGNK
jgi:hypothetical protein